MQKPDSVNLITEQLEESIAAHQALLQSGETIKLLSLWGIRCAEALEKGGTIFFAGNGGSFADAQHMAAELTGKMGRMRRSLSGLALGANNSSLSAIGNDFGFELAFARELEGLHKPHSVVIAFSTSGDSKNLVELAKQAKDLEIPMLCLTGAKKGQIAEYCEILQVPSTRTERIQEIQTLLGHTLCLVIEEEMGLSNEPYNS